MKNFYCIIICCVLWSLELQAQEQEVKHIVKKGESLSELAKYYYKDLKKWRFIYDVNSNKELEIAINPITKKPYDVPNKLISPNQIFEGQILTIIVLVGCEEPPPPLTDKDFIRKTEGVWKIINGNSSFIKNTYYKVEKDGKLYTYNKDVYSKEHWTEIGTWWIEDKKNRFIIQEKEYWYSLDEEAFQAGKFGCYQLDSSGNQIEKFLTIRMSPPAKTSDISGKVYYNGKPLVGVSIKGEGKTATSDISGSYTLNLKDGAEIKFEKENYETKQVQVQDWKVQEVVSLEREEFPIPSRIFSGQI